MTSLRLIVGLLVISLSATGYLLSKNWDAIQGHWEVPDHRSRRDRPDPPDWAFKFVKKHRDNRNPLWIQVDRIRKTAPPRPLLRVHSNGVCISKIDFALAGLGFSERVLSRQRIQNLSDELLKMEPATTAINACSVSLNGQDTRIERTISVGALQAALSPHFDQIPPRAHKLGSAVISAVPTRSDESAGTAVLSWPSLKLHLRDCSDTPRKIRNSTLRFLEKRNLQDGLYRDKGTVFRVILQPKL